MLQVIVIRCRLKPLPNAALLASLVARMRASHTRVTAQVEPCYEHAPAVAPPASKAGFLAEQAASQLAWMRESTWHPEDLRDAALQPSDSPAFARAADGLPEAAGHDGREDAPPCKRQRLADCAEHQPPAGPRTTRGMLGYPPPRQRSQKIKVVQWASGWRGTVEMVGAATVPAWLRKGEWPNDSAAWRKPPVEQSAAGDGVAAPLHAAMAQVKTEHPAEALTGHVQSQKRGLDAAGMDRLSRPEGHDELAHGWAAPRAHALLAAVEGASASYEAAPESDQRAQSVGTDDVLAEERARGRKRSRDRNVASDSVERPAVAPKSASRGVRTVRRTLPGFDTATQKQRDTGSQNPAWALMQVVGHCTDVEVTDDFHAWCAQVPCCGGRSSNNHCARPRPKCR